MNKAEPENLSEAKKIHERARNACVSLRKINTMLMDTVNKSDLQVNSEAMDNIVQISNLLERVYSMVNEIKDASEIQIHIHNNINMVVDLMMNEYTLLSRTLEICHKDVK